MDFPGPWILLLLRRGILATLLPSHPQASITTPLELNIPPLIVKASVLNLGPSDPSGALGQNSGSVNLDVHCFSG